MFKKLIEELNELFEPWKPADEEEIIRQHAKLSASASREWIENYKDRYKEICDYAEKNWQSLTRRATKADMSVASQLTNIFCCPYDVAKGIANEISLRK